MKTHLNPNQIEGTYFVFNLTEVPAFEPGRITKSLTFMMPSITSPKKKIISMIWSKEPVEMGI